ncbi:MAG: FMN-binding protein [Actinomycetota bacterium]|nr:FMN-binding protein [Actinomycetota bacterium]
MRRALAAIAGTILGLTLLLGFRTSPQSSSGSVPSASAPAGTGTAAAPGASPAPTTSGGATTAGSTGTASGTGTVLGAVVSTRYGPVQVRVTESSGKITEVAAVQLPGGHQRSVQINNAAAPILRREALAAQSAQIDTVSGATYTSDGYTESLQAALDAMKR